MNETTPPTPEPPVAEVHFGAVPETDQIPVARRVVNTVAGACSQAEREALSLVTSELLANAVAHAQTWVEVQVELYPGHLRLRVMDDGDGRPGLQSLGDPLAESGRGLQIVDHFTADWGVEDLIPGKQVWCVLARCGADGPDGQGDGRGDGHPTAP